MSILDKINECHPKYPVTIPSTNENTFFRPYLMKEQKILLLAQTESKNFSTLKAISTIVENCVDGIDNALQTPLHDIEYLFCQIRAKSVSEMAEPTFTCPDTGQMVKIGVNLEDVKISKGSKNNVIKINDKITIHMKHPVIQDYFNAGTENFEDSLIAECIEKIIVGDEVFGKNEIEKSEKIEVLESLTQTQYTKLLKFLNDQPKVYSDVEYRTNDQVIRKLKLSGIYDFFG